MASRDALYSQLGAFPQELRAPMRRIIDLITKMRIGHPANDVTGSPLTNFDGAFLQATTPGTPDEAFSIAHGLTSTPYLVVPVLRLDVQGAVLVPLTVTQPADAKRIYLSSTAADAPICVWVEG